MTHSTFARIAASLAMLGVALGAFGAHGLREQLEAVNRGIDTWRTAVFYQLIHAVVMYFLATTGGSLRACQLFAVGIIIFSGTLYPLALKLLPWLGPVTPFGGILLIAGWGTLLIQKRSS